MTDPPDPRRLMHAANQCGQWEDLRLPLVLAALPRSRHQSLCRLPTRRCLQHLVPRRTHSEETKPQVQQTLTRERHDSIKRLWIVPKDLNDTEKLSIWWVEGGTYWNYNWKYSLKCVFCRDGAAAALHNVRQKFQLVKTFLYGITFPSHPVSRSQLSLLSFPPILSILSVFFLPSCRVTGGCSTYLHTTWTHLSSQNLSSNSTFRWAFH